MNLRKLALLCNTVCLIFLFGAPAIARPDSEELTAFELGTRSVVCESDNKSLVAVWASNAPAKIDVYLYGKTNTYGSLEVPLQENETIVGIRFGSKPGDGIYALSSNGKWMRWLIASGQPAEVKQFEDASGLKSMSRFSADGNWGVCATLDGWSAWDIGSGKLIAKSDGKDGQTLELAILQTGNAFLSVGTTGATWFDVQQKKIASRISDIEIDAGKSKTSPGRKFIAGAGKEKVHIFEVDAMLADFADFKPSNDQADFDFANDRYLLVSTFEQYKKPIDVWNLKTGLKDFRFANPIPDRTKGPIAAFPKSDQVLFIGKRDDFPSHAGFLVKPIDGKSTYSFGDSLVASSASDKQSYPFLKISPSEEYLLVANGERELQVWKLGNYSVRSFKDQSQRKIAEQPSGSMLGLFDLPSTAIKAEFFGDESMVRLTLVDGNEFLINMRTGFDRFDSISIQERETDGTFMDYARSRIQELDFSPDGKLLLYQTNRVFSVVDPSTGKEVYSNPKEVIKGWFDSTSQRVMLATSSEWQKVDLRSKGVSTANRIPKANIKANSKLATRIFIDRKLAVIDPDQFAEIARLDVEAGQCGPAELSPDGKWLAVTMRENGSGEILEIFDMSTMESYSKIKVEKDGIYDIAFIGDASQVAVTGGNQVRIYDYKRSRMVKAFPEKEKVERPKLSDSTGTVVMRRAMASVNMVSYGDAPIGSMAFHQPSNRMAIGRKGHVEIWDVENATLLFHCGLECNYISAIAFSPDGKQVAAGGSKNWIQILQLPQ